jgi:hypothetical protein
MAINGLTALLVLYNPMKDVRVWNHIKNTTPIALNSASIEEYRHRLIGA